jgi:MerR family copper efflux transcriptional regulator
MSTQPLEQPHLIRVGDLARQTGKTVRAIHLYEEQGLLQPARRTSGGFRLYEANAIERVRWIEQLHELGFSLNDMRGLLTAWWNAGLGPDAMADLRALFTRKLEHARGMIARYVQLEHELVDGLRYLETCRVCATPSTVKTCVHCTQDHGMKEEPALVAGIVTSPGNLRRASRPALVRLEDIESKSGRASSKAAHPVQMRKEPTE